MLKPNIFVTNEESHILLLSMREIANLVAYVSLYEFEDIVYDLNTSDMVKPASYYDVVLSRQIYKRARHLIQSNRLTDLLIPRFNSLFLEKEYELFFPIFNNPFELFSLRLFNNWQKKCDKAVCYIVEVWEPFIQKQNRYLLDFLKDFDHIFLGMSHATEAVSELTGRPCTYLPPAVDTLKFCPYPLLPHRNIDVCYLGRRSDITHQALLTLAEQQKIFYYYDTIKSSGVRKLAKQQTFQVNSPKEHRLLLANLTKRSRYFVTNRALANQLETTQGKQEIASRFFEGAASGTVMIGDPPFTEQFKKYFDWQDAVIKIPFHTSEIGDIIAELDSQPEYLARIRKDNVVNSLLKHDWIYRLREVFNIIGVQPSEKMLCREANLKKLADEIQQASHLQFST